MIVVAGASSASAASVVPAHIAVSVSPSPPAVGQTIRVTAVAKDSSGMTFSGFSAPATWSDRSGALSPAAPADFVNGVSTTVAHVDTAFHNDVITITSGSSGTSRAFNVVGPLDHLSASLPSADKVDTPFTVTVSARDAANNLVSSFTGPASWSDSAGALAASPPNDFVAGVSKTSVQSSQPLRGDRLTIESGGLSVLSGAFNVIGAATHLELLAPASWVPAGTAFKLIAHARDAAGNIATGYSGAASWTETSGTLTPSAPSDFVAGVSTTTVQVPIAVKSDLVTLTSGGMSTHRRFAVIGPVDHIALAWTTSSVASRCAAATGSLVARAVDTAGSIVPTYNDPSPFWFLQGGHADPEISPTSPAPFIAGVSDNPNVTLTPTGQTILTISLITGGRIANVTVCNV